MRKIKKPWGYEVVWAETDSYVGKLLHINAGNRLSLQYHRTKEETVYVLSGVFLSWIACAGNLYVDSIPAVFA